MFWIICSIISGICIKFTLTKNKDDSMCIKSSTIGASIITTVFILIASVQFGVGIDVYPSLAGDLAEVKALEKRIEDIRGSKYKYEKDGILIAGSVENYKQSTNLSEFIAILAKKEAAYSSALRTAKVHKEVLTLHFFDYGWAISDRIDELPILKGVDP